MRTGDFAVGELTTFFGKSELFLKIYTLPLDWRFGGVKTFYLALLAKAFGDFTAIGSNFYVDLYITSSFYLESPFSIIF